MDGKLNPGDSPLKGPLNAPIWNSVIDSRDDHQQRTRQKVTGYPGNGKPYRPNWTRNWHTVVKARNVSGTSLRRGDVIEFSSTPLLSITENDSIWLTGVAVDLSHVGWGVALDPIAYNASSPEIGDVLIAGACVAYVDVVNESHKYADRVNGSTTLRSQLSPGPAKIISKPSGTGELRCFVQIMDEHGSEVEIVEVFHSSATNGNIVEANAAGYHPGRIRTPNGTDTYSVGADVWVQFAEGFDGHPDDDGAIVAVQGEYYGPAKKAAGTFDLVTGETHDERPVYVPICDERSFVGVAGSPIARYATGTVALLHSTTLASAGINKTGTALQDIPVNSLVKISRIAGVWMIELLDRPRVRFELLEELSLTGHAKAKLKLPAGGGVWADTDPVVEIEVYDPYRPEGMWSGLAGYQGFAIPRGQVYTDPGEDEEDPEDDEEREAYDVQWMERIAQAIEFTTVEYTGATIADQLANSLVTWFDHQGKDPGSTVTIHDPQGQFPDVFAGAVGKAQYDNHDKKYRIVNCQRVALFATAQLTADTCPDAESITITGFTIHPTGNYVGSPPTAPTTVAGSIAGLASDTVWLRRTTNAMPSPGWEAIRVTKHAVDVVIDNRYASLNLQHKVRTIYAEVCDDTPPDWATYTTATECTE